MVRTAIPETLIFAGAFALATEALSKRSERAGGEKPVAIFATGAIASLALALSLALEKGWLSVAFALMVPGVAWIGQKRRWPVLRWLAVSLIMLVVGLALSMPTLGPRVTKAPLISFKISIQRQERRRKARSSWRAMEP